MFHCERAVSVKVDAGRGRSRAGRSHALNIDVSIYIYCKCRTSAKKPENFVSGVEMLTWVGWAATNTRRRDKMGKLIVNLAARLC
jgi:hypothetical protein